MLNIPNRLKDLLGSNQGYYAFVQANIANLSEWIVDNKTVFFPEYTDHSFVHLNEVIKTADSLIADESWQYLSAQDSAAIITSVLLHDCAMHLSEDGFYTLINGIYSEISSRYISNEKTWVELWTDFMAEAKRFDAKKLISIFGDDQPVHNIPDKKVDLKLRDRLLIGEFIRRHHARLAHEIAFNGIPGVSGASVKLSNEPDKGFLDLCGFIARSHNMTLRNAVDALEKNKKRVHLNTHVPYVMLLLRVSDYIQIQSTRAPEKLLEIKTLLSPISKGEWKKHAAIIDVNQAHDDPEAIFVDAEPDNAIVLEELIKLFNGFQAELDTSWSVLGEVYGRYEPLNNLGITIRRIRTSLDNIDNYVKEKKPKFIPKVLKFQTSDTEMMELLIKPLYGDSPYAGIRELLQNSVDACLELDNLIKKRGLWIEGHGTPISITIFDDEEEFSRVEIEDHGIGMTLEIIQNYFLNIGASFRNSDIWRKSHQTQGRSDIHRTGRFGIGLLAAFLLGDELQVETRHYSQSENRGLRFSCKKSDQTITVTNCKMHIGTKIVIKIKSQTLKLLINNKLQWDWFTLTSPVVKRIIVKGKQITELPQKNIVPGPQEVLSGDDWYRINAEGFDDILWTYNPLNREARSYYKNILVCNGIFVREGLSEYRSRLDFEISNELGAFDMKPPSLIIFDQDGKLPLNLQRNELLTNKLPFQQQLKDSLAKYAAIKLYAFSRKITDIRIDIKTISELSQFKCEGMDSSSFLSIGGMSKFIICSRQLIPIDLWVLSEHKPSNLYLDPLASSVSEGLWKSEEFTSNVVNYLPVRAGNNSKGDKSQWVRNFFEIRTYGDHERGLHMLPFAGRRLLIREEDFKLITGKGYVPITFIRQLVREWSNDKWVLYKLGNVPTLEFDIEKVVSEIDGKATLGFIAYYFDWGQMKETGSSPLSAAWSNINQI